MEIPGWVFILVGGVVTAMSTIIYFTQGTFQLFIFLGVAFLTYGIYKTIIDKVVKKGQAEVKKDLEQYGKKTQLKDLPVGQQLYYQQHYSQRNAGNAMQRPLTEYEKHQAYMRQIQGQGVQQPHTRQNHPAQHQAAQQHAATQSHSKYMMCQRCGAQQHPANFCANCGTRMR